MTDDMGRDNTATGNGEAMPPSKALWRSYERVIAEPMRQVDAESRRYLASPAARGVDWKTIAVLVTATVSLALQYFFIFADGFPQTAAFLERVGLGVVPERISQALSVPENQQANKLTAWALGSILTYTILPVLVIRLVFREHVRAYGIKLKGAFTDLWIYGVMLVVMAPLILLVSLTKSFQDTYPFYTLHRGEPLWPHFWRWEILYAFQFLALEFFFRGFLVHGTKHRFGCYSIFVMSVPYCMIHFGKPMPETFAAIVAGIVLGFMSLKTRSIWLGTVIHITVAWSMDFVSLWRKELIG